MTAARSPFHHALAVPALLFGAAPACLEAAALLPVSTYVWDEDKPGFGGFSGLAMDDNGAGFLAVSDNGWMYRAEISRDAQGRIASVASAWYSRLLKNPGEPADDAFSQDAEALAIGHDGTIYVGYESLTRIVSVTLPELTPTWLHRWDRFKAYWGNESIEGLTEQLGGGLLAVLEVPNTRGGYATLVQTADDWTEGPIIPGAGDYAASDAAFGPDDKLYILERRTTLFGRFATRVRRFGWDRHGVTDAGEVLLETQPGTLDNMEGLSFWHRADGRTMVTLISDDNFMLLQTTMLADYELAE